MHLLLFVLFVALTPGILVSFPPKANKLVVAVTHGVIFVLLVHLMHVMFHIDEGFQSGSGSAPPAPPPFTGITINSSDIDPVKGLLKDAVTSLKATITKMIPLYSYIMGTNNQPVSVTLTPSDLQTVKAFYNATMGQSVPPATKQATMGSVEKVMGNLRTAAGPAILYVIKP